jgi:hypothetical protein
MSNEEQKWFCDAVGVPANETAEKLPAVEGRVFGEGGLLHVLHMAASDPAFKSGYADPKNKGQKLDGPTRKTWLESIPKGGGSEHPGDALSPPPGYSDKTNAPYDERESMGSLHKLEEGHRLQKDQQLADGEVLQEGHDYAHDNRFESVKRVILELRDFGNDVPADKWVPHAVGMAELLNVSTGEMPTQDPMTEQEKKDRAPKTEADFGNGLFD